MPQGRLPRPMALEVLATTAGVAVLMAVLPRALFALRLGRADELGEGAAFLLMLVAGGLAVLGAWLGHLPTVVANVAAAATCTAYVVLFERCRAIQAERRAIRARLGQVRPARRLRARS